MSVTFAEKLSRIPHYEPGMPLEDAQAAAESGDAVKLASNESPYPPHPKVIEAIQGAAAGANRYPDPAARLLRRRIAERHETDVARVTLSNGSCEILLAAAVALCDPGSEILFAWPSFSMYPYMAPLSGAREVRVPLKDDYSHDLGAMLAEVTAATQLLVICNPNNPTGNHIPAAELAGICERVPGHVTVILDEAYIDFQATEDTDASLALLDRFSNLVVLRTFSKVYGLAGLRVGYGLGSPQFRSALDAVRQPYSVNSIAQAAAAEAILHQDDVASRVEKNLAERSWVEERVGELGLVTAPTQSNFSWIDLGDRDEAEVVEALGAAGVAVRPGTPLGGPGHIRVSYGTRPENEKFISALSDAL